MGGRSPPIKQSLPQYHYHVMLGASIWRYLLAISALTAGVDRLKLTPVANRGRSLVCAIAFR